MNAPNATVVAKPRVVTAPVLPAKPAIAPCSRAMDELPVSLHDVLRALHRYWKDIVDTGGVRRTASALVGVQRTAASFASPQAWIAMMGEATVKQALLSEVGSRVTGGAFSELFNCARFGEGGATSPAALRRAALEMYALVTLFQRDLTPLIEALYQASLRFLVVAPVPHESIHTAAAGILLRVLERVERLAPHDPTVEIAGWRVQMTIEDVATMTEARDRLCQAIKDRKVPTSALADDALRVMRYYARYHAFRQKEGRGELVLYANPDMMLTWPELLKYFDQPDLRARLSIVKLIPHLTSWRETRRTIERLAGPVSATS